MLFFALYKSSMMKKIVLFASGGGSNAENIINYFHNSDAVNVVHVFCNNSNAGVIQKVRALDVKVTVFRKDEFLTTILEQLNAINPDLIVLAGFLLKMPSEIVNKFPNIIINIHPALLPKYGGKGMYGMNVHLAVLASNDAETGISIHYVNENYDEGNIIFQEKVDVSKCISAEEIAEQIHILEQKYFPVIIDNILQQTD